MVGRKELSRTSFDKDAPAYDTAPRYASLRATYRSFVQEALRCRFDRCLDVGCGTGELLSLIAGERSEARLCGVDLSERMIGVARGKLGSRARLVVGDAESLPFDDNGFDLVTCTFSFHHYPNPGGATAEMARVLAPNGRLLIADGWLPVPLRQLANLVMVLSRDGDVKFYSRNEMGRFVRQAGLVVLDWTALGPNARVMVARKPSLYLPSESDEVRAGARRTV